MPEKLNQSALPEWSDLPEPSYFRDMEFYIRRSRRSYRMRIPRASEADQLLYCGCICEVDLLGKARYLRRHAPFLSIEYVQSGRLLVRQRDQVYALEAGDVFLMQPEIENEFCATRGGCRKISAMISGAMLNDFLTCSRLGETDTLHCSDREQLEQYLADLGELSDEPENEHSNRNSTLTFAMLQFLRSAPDRESIPAPLATLHFQVSKHPEQPWSLDSMASVCGCSSTHLVRQFRRYFRTTPGQYLLDMRMKNARELLTADELSIKEIAARSGYENAMNFSTEFRKRFGCPPREFRKRMVFFA